VRKNSIKAESINLKAKSFLVKNVNSGEIVYKIKGALFVEDTFYLKNIYLQKKPTQMRQA
jgi:hypothetical protein